MRDSYFAIKELIIVNAIKMLRSGIYSLIIGLAIFRKVIFREL